MIVAMQDTDGNRYIWDELLRQWVPVTGAMSPAELAAEMAPTLRSQYGTVVLPAGSDQTADINAALAVGSVKLVPGGAYTISDPLVIKSNTVFDCRGATITLAAGSDCNMLIDEAHSNGTLTVPSPIANITVLGGRWDRGANAGSFTGLHSIILGGTNIKLIGAEFASTAGKYAVLLQNVTDFVVQDIFLDNTHSDGVHIDGPAARGFVRNVYGKAGDDMVAITPCNWTGYTWGNEGDVSDILIDGVLGFDTASRHVIVLSGRLPDTTVLNTSRIVVRNVSGYQRSGNIQPAILIGDDVTQANTREGRLKDVTIDNVTVAIDSVNLPVVGIGGNTNSLTIARVVVRNVHVISDVSAVVSNNGKVTTLIVDGVTGATTATAMTSVVNFANNAWVAATRVMLSNIDLTFTGTRGGSLVKASISGQTLTSVMMTNVRLDNAAWVADFITSTSLRASNCEFTSMGGIFNVRSPAAVVVHGWSGCTSSNASSTITSTGTVRSLALDFPLDINNAQVASARVAGDRCTTRLTAGSIAANQPVVYDGTSWYELASQTTF